MNFFYNKPTPKFAFNLKRFGEVGYILKRDKGIKSKISNRGMKGIMVGYAKQSTGDTYRMFNLSTNKITNTRDVKWSHKLIGEMTTDERKKDDYYTASEDEDESVETTEDGNQTETASNEQPRRSERIRNMNEAEQRVARAMRKLDMSGNMSISRMAFIDDLAMVGGTDESYDNPDTFDEAWEHPNISERGCCR